MFKEVTFFKFVFITNYLIIELTINDVGEKMKQAIESLIQYEINRGIILKRDYHYIKNQLYHLLNLTNDGIIYEPNKITYPQEALDIILDNLEQLGTLDGSQTQRDLFDAKIMNVFAKKPSDVESVFWSLYKESSLKATTWYYEYMKSLNYIRFDRILKNKHFSVDSKYGIIELTINLSKPEKDPKSIALALRQESTAYPKCVLCIENEGFSGNFTRDSRDQHRVIEVELNDGKWYFQYSPYIYYDEHAIVFTEEHKPMKTDKQTFMNLLMLTDIFEGYFFGSNADMPIVGGSILSHSHYQGGKYTLPIENATTLKTFKFNDVAVSILNWPMASLRFESKNKEALVNYAYQVFDCWKMYENKALDIVAYTDGVSNHTVTPIARKHGDTYFLDMILRDNHTTDAYPLGVYHLKEDVWHVKKENIGLIEASGLAILPGRLINELKEVKQYLLYATPLSEAAMKHQDFVEKLRSMYQFTSENIQQILNQEVGNVFIKGLIDCSVFKESNYDVFEDFILNALR